MCITAIAGPELDLSTNDIDPSRGHNALRATTSLPLLNDSSWPVYFDIDHGIPCHQWCIWKFRH